MFFGLFKKRERVVNVKRKSSLKKKSETKRGRRPSARSKKANAGKKGREIKRIKKTTQTALKGTLQEIGRISHYFPHVHAGVVSISSGKIALGDILYIKGNTTDFKQKVTSIQINNTAVKNANPGDTVGLLVKSRVRHNDIVYKI